MLQALLIRVMLRANKNGWDKKNISVLDLNFYRGRSVVKFALFFHLKILTLSKSTPVKNLLY